MHSTARTRFEPFRASAPDDLVSGASILAFVNAMGAFRGRALRLLSARGIPEPSPEAWYPWQAYLDVLREIHGANGSAMVALTGKRLVDGHEFPPHIDSIEKGLSPLDADYRARHRGRDVGSFTFRKVDDRSAEVVVRNPYPCSLDRGVIEAIAQRFSPDGSIVRVQHGEGGCRHDGATECAIQLRW